MENTRKYKLIPDWSIPEGRKKTIGQKMMVHPYKYISYVQKKLGLEKAIEVATILVKKKYDKRFDQVTFVIPE